MYQIIDYSISLQDHSLEIKNVLEKSSINSFVSYGERKLNLFIFTTLVSNTTCTNASRIFIHHNHIITYGFYHFLNEIFLLQSFVLS